MTQLWSAKEAVYKALRQPGIHFSERIRIEQFTANTAAATATVGIIAATKFSHIL